MVAAVCVVAVISVAWHWHFGFGGSPALVSMSVEVGDAGSDGVGDALSAGVLWSSGAGEGGVNGSGVSRISASTWTRSGKFGVGYRRQPHCEVCTWQCGQVLRRPRLLAWAVATKDHAVGSLWW